MQKEKSRRDRGAWKQKRNKEKRKGMKHEGWGGLDRCESSEMGDMPTIKKNNGRSFSGTV